MSRVAIVQARMNSSRLPGKVLIDLNGKPVLINILERVSQAKLVEEVVVATSNQPSDNEIEMVSKDNGYKCFRGDLENVLKRFYECATTYHADTIVRLTADNAMVDPDIIDEAIELFEKSDLNYLEYKSTLPLGMCVEVFDYLSLETAYREAKDSECLEHVTPYLYENSEMFKSCRYVDLEDEDHSDLRFTMDTEEDYEFVSRIFNYFKDNKFSYTDIIDVLKLHPEWVAINSNIAQKEVCYQGEGKRN